MVRGKKKFKKVNINKKKVKVATSESKDFIRGLHIIDDIKRRKKKK